MMVLADEAGTLPVGDVESCQGPAWAAVLPSLYYTYLVVAFVG